MAVWDIAVAALDVVVVLPAGKGVENVKTNDICVCMCGYLDEIGGDAAQCGTTWSVCGAATRP